VLGVLIAAKHAGSIASLHTEIEKLRRDAGFFVDRPLEARVLALVGE
jgi:predicted nucleic acid-binding protein